MLRSLAAAVLVALLVLAGGWRDVAALTGDTAAPSNPVSASDFPDPFVLPARGMYYAYSTNGSRGNIQTLRSADLATWTAQDDALPVLPEWASPGRTWAPAVLERSGGYLLYYATHDAALNMQCISVATAAQPAGPFVDSSRAPLICQTDLGGSIDPQPFADAAGNVFVVWKADTWYGVAGLWSQQLSSDGRALIGSAVQLLRADQPWEANNIEGPAMLRVGDAYHLYFSGNYWTSGAYAVGAAVCSTPLGPCAQAGGPVYGSRGGAVGPGGESFFTDLQGDTRMAYHAWTGGQVGAGHARTMRIDRVGLAGSEPRLFGPTSLSGRVAVTGGDNGLWQITGSGGSDFTNGGGILIAAPAVVIAGSPAVPLTIATGGDHDLWVRSDTQGWQRLSTSPVYCLDNPAATVIGGTTLVVACQGGDHALWTASGPLAGGLPLLRGWSSLGGILSAGPAVTTVAGALSFLVLGTDSRVYIRTPNSGYQATSWLCTGHPAAASAAGTAYFGCDGRDHALWWSQNRGGGWSAALSLGGRLVDGPAVSAWPQGATFSVQGTDSALWETTVMDGWRSRFSSDGGVLRYGVGSAS